MVGTIAAPHNKRMQSGKMSAFSIKQTFKLNVLNVCFPAKADIRVSRRKTIKLPNSEVQTYGRG